MLGSKFEAATDQNRLVLSMSEYLIQESVARKEKRQPPLMDETTLVSGLGSILLNIYEGSEPHLNG